MAKRPRRRFIANVEYKIEYLDAHDIRIDQVDGLCDFHTRTIYISKSPSSEHYTQEHVIEHECIHALLHERGIRDLDDRFEHTIVEAMVDYIMEIKYG